MPSQNELQDYIGRKIMVPALDYSGHKAGVEFAATVRDAKSAYGCVRLLVHPVNGEGTAWVDLKRVRIVDGRGQR
jgi:hypothetical protein